MPNTKSAKKALRQSEARRVKNLSQKRGLRKTIKLYESLLNGNDPKAAENQLSVTYKALDKAAKVGVIKKNKASRLKSRLSLKLKNNSGALNTQPQQTTTPEPAQAEAPLENSTPPSEAQS